MFFASISVMIEKKLRVNYIEQGLVYQLSEHRLLIHMNEDVIRDSASFRGG
jgi:hypothetical protein